MASATNLCQHSDIDGTQCTSNEYICCPHCQLQLCLKHLNAHQELLRLELHNFCDDINHIRINLDNLIFDSNNQRDSLFQQLDNWYNQQINLIKKYYDEKKQEIQILCLKSQMEFDIYKTKKDKQLKDNLTKQLNKVLKQKQIHIDDLNEMKRKLDYIQRGLDELKHLNIEMHCHHTNFHINLIKRRYIEAAKPLFNDDDNNLWETDNDDEIEEDESHNNNLPQQTITASSIILCPLISTNPPSSSSTTTIKKSPLKLVIKRLQHPTISTKIKYQLHTVNTSVPIRTS